MAGSKSHPVFKRLAIAAYVEFSDRFKKEAERMVVDEFENEYLREDYDRLLVKRFAGLSGPTKQRYLDLVGAGPSGGFPGSRQAERRARWWKKDRLGPVLGHLDEDQKIPFRELIREMERSPMPGRWGPRTPPEAHLADGLDAGRVLSLVRPHTPGGRPHGCDGGTASKFRKYARSRPLEFSRRALDLRDANVGFSGCCFQAWGMP